MRCIEFFVLEDTSKEYGMGFLFPDKDGDNKPLYIEINGLVEFTGFDINGAKSGMSFQEIIDKLGYVKPEHVLWWHSVARIDLYILNYDINGLKYSFVSDDEQGKWTELYIALDGTSNSLSNDPLENLCYKRIQDYTLDDCFVILNSTMNDIGKAYNIDASKVFGGLTLLGNTSWQPMVCLDQGILLVCPIQDHPNDNKVAGNASPFIIYFSGNDGESCVIDGFQFGMPLDQVDQELLVTAKDSFFHIYSGDPIPAKWIGIFEKGMEIRLAFKQDLEKDCYYLDNICVELNEN